MNPGHLGVRALTSAALAGSGILAYLAAWQRWSGVCPRGGFDEPACLKRQDHRYDYQWPSNPWDPIGDAAQLYGLSVLLLAVAAFALPFLLTPAYPRRTLWPLAVIPLAVIPAGVLAGLGVLVLASGMAGRPITVPGFYTTAFYVVGVLWPIALVVCALAAAGGYSTTGSPPAPGDRRPGTRFVSMMVTALLIAATTVFPTYFLVGPIAAGYVSHDTAPWTEAPSGVFLVLAAIVVWPATTRITPRPSTRDPQSDFAHVS